MLPGLPLLWILYWVIRSANSAPSASRAPQTGVLGRPVPISGVSLAIWLLAAILTGIALAALDTPWVAAVFLPISIVLVFPWIVVRQVLVPLGMCKTAYVLARSALWVWRWDPHGGAAFEATLAVWSRRGKREEDKLRWIEARLARHANEPLRGAGIAAHASLLALRGDPATAWTLFESLDALDPRAATRPGQRAAARFLLANAVVLGRWAVVAELAARHRRITRLAPLLSMLAAAHMERAPVPRVRVWLRWAAAPGRRRMLPFVRDTIALAARDTPVATAPPWPWPVQPPFEEALRLHAALGVTREGPDLSRAWIECARAWARVGQDETGIQRAEERAARLGVVDPRVSVRKFLGQTIFDLAHEAMRAGIGTADLAQGGIVGARVASTLEESFHRDLQFRGSTIRDRMDRGPILAPLSDWKEFAEIRGLERLGSERLGALFRRGAFEITRAPVEKLGVTLYNLRNEKALANGVFRWLAERAADCGAHETAEIYRKNVRLGF